MRQSNEGHAGNLQPDNCARFLTADDVWDLAVPYLIQLMP